MAQADHFFSRWSRRKVAVGQGLPVEEPPATSAPPLPAVSASVPASSPGPSQAASPGGAQSTPGVQTDASGPSAKHSADEPAPPGLEDTLTLTKDSDFKPFMARNVPPEVKNAAMKKLFADPHYNVMDRLDIYIDDYSQPDPLPASMLRQMASAKFLNLFEDEDEPSGKIESHPGDVANTVGTADVAQCAASPATVAEPIEPSDLTVSTPMTAQTPANPNDHAHADLRLQPHHAALGPEFGDGAQPDTGSSQRAVPP